MFPPLQWNELHLKAWSWLRSVLLQRHVQFEVECDPMRYENKVETTTRIHTLNLFNENNPKGVQKPSQNDHLLINATCIGMSI